MHAASYVYGAAALEKFMTESLSATVDQINAAQVPHKYLRLSLFAISCSSHFEALTDLRGLKKWERRVVVLDYINDTSHCSLDVSNLPLDGRTIRKKHFDTIWQVFGFPNSSLPDQRCGLALSNLADSRNDVAHGDEDPYVVAGQRSVTDTLKILDRVEDVVLHLYEQANLYLSNQLYLR